MDFAAKMSNFFKKPLQYSVENGTFAIITIIQEKQKKKHSWFGFCTFFQSSSIETPIKLLQIRHGQGTGFRSGTAVPVRFFLWNGVPHSSFDFEDRNGIGTGFFPGTAVPDLGTAVPALERPFRNGNGNGTIPFRS